MMLARIVVAIVNAQHQRDVFIGRRRGDDRFLSAGIEMRAYLRAVGENPGGFDDDVDAELFPRQAGGIFLIEHGDGLAVDLHRRRRRIRPCRDKCRRSNRSETGGRWFSSPPCR